MYSLDYILYYFPLNIIGLGMTIAISICHHRVGMTQSIVIKVQNDQVLNFCTKFKDLSFRALGFKKKSFYIHTYGFQKAIYVVARNLGKYDKFKKNNKFRIMSSPRRLRIHKELLLLKKYHDVRIISS
jgi:hypothetical protein